MKALILTSIGLWFAVVVVILATSMSDQSNVVNYAVRRLLRIKTLKEYLVDYELSREDKIPEHLVIC